MKHNEINTPYLLDHTYGMIQSIELEAKMTVTEKKSLAGSLVGSARLPR
jgi:hypothetical protein